MLIFALIDVNNLSIIVPKSISTCINVNITVLLTQLQVMIDVNFVLDPYNWFHLALILNCAIHALHPSTSSLSHPRLLLALALSFALSPPLSPPPSLSLSQEMRTSHYIKGYDSHHCWKDIKSVVIPVLSCGLSDHQFIYVIIRNNNRRNQPKAGW